MAYCLDQRSFARVDYSYDGRSLLRVPGSSGTVGGGSFEVEVFVARKGAREMFPALSLRMEGGGTRAEESCFNCSSIRMLGTLSEIGEVDVKVVLNTGSQDAMLFLIFSVA